MHNVGKLALFGTGGKLSRLDLDSGYIGNIYPLCVSLSGKLKIALYWRHGNTTLLGSKKYNTQFHDDPNKQNFMWGK